MLRIQRYPYLDDNESMFFARELEAVKAKTYDIVFPELKATSLIPVSTEAGPGADVKGQEFLVPVKTIGTAYGWNVKEIQAAARAGKPLQMRKASAARRAFDTLVDQIAWHGDASNRLRGLLTHPNVPAALAATGASGTTLWEDKTAAEILTDLNGMVTGIIDLTNGAEFPDTILLPVAQYGQIATKPRSANSDTTVLDFFLATSPWVNTVVPVHTLKNVSPAIVGGGDSSDVAVAYKKNPDILTLELPTPFTQTDAEPRGLEFTVNCYGDIAGVIIYRPLSVAILEGI